MGGLLITNGASGAVITSPDGITWTSRSTPSSGMFYSSAAYDPDRDMVVITSADAAPVNHLRSTDGGVSWTQHSSPGDRFYGKTAWVKELGLFIAGGGGGVIVTSPDGITWTSRTTPTTVSMYGGVEWAPAWNLVVASGYSGTILTSPDGITWTSRTTPNSNSNPYSGLYWFPDSERMVAPYQDGTIIYSDDGITWSTANVTGGTLTSEFYSGPAYSPELGKAFIINSTSQVYETSDDGLNWSYISTPSINSAYGTMAWNPVSELLVISGASGTILTSPDGISWTSRTTPTSEALYGGVVWLPNKPSLPVNLSVLATDVTPEFSADLTHLDGTNTKAVFEVWTSV